MKKRFIIALCHHDSSGVIQSFGPYETEEAANAAEVGIGDIVNLYGSTGRFVVTPCYDFGEVE